MDSEKKEIRFIDIFKTWWPIAISWVILALEPQFLSSVIARFPNSEVNLAAYGNIAHLIPIFLQSPIMLLHAASAALCKDIETFKKLRKFTYAMTIGLTLVHLLIALTPLYFFVTRNLLNLPEEVVQAGRPGLILMLPWAGAITYRRFHQGILIRFGHTKRMGFGTILRLISDVICVLILANIKGISGLVVATAAQGFSVFLEGAYVGAVTQKIVKKQLKPSVSGVIIRWKEFRKYYTPLLVNAIVMVLINPLNSAALGRMPMALASLSTWPVVNGFGHMVGNLGQPSREITLTYIRNKGSFKVIRKFCLTIGIIASSILALFTFTPLLNWYLRVVVSLPEHLIPYAKTASIFIIPVGVIRSLSNMYTGIVSYNRKTTSLLMSTIAQMSVVFLGLMLGIFFWPYEGIYAIAIVSLIASLVQLIWIHVKNKNYLSQIQVKELDREANEAN